MNLLLDISLEDVTINLLYFIVPSAIIFGVTYNMIKNFLDEQRNKRNYELKKQSMELLTPVKLQAYERLTILLDRISPDHLILRLTQANPKESATEFKHRLIHQINEEYNHNVSQQVYVSDQAWKLVTTIKEKLLTQIDNCYRDMPEQAKGTDLGKSVLESMMQNQGNICQEGIAFLKKEISIVF